MIIVKVPELRMEYSAEYYELNGIEFRTYGSVPECNKTFAHVSSIKRNVIHNSNLMILTVTLGEKKWAK